MGVATDRLIVDRIAVTVPLDAPDGVDIDGMIPAFHGWIQRGVVPGTLIDVADYRHVHNGPAVMLIAHELDYTLDLAEGGIGMTVTRKRTAGPTELAKSVAWCLEHAQQAIAALSEDVPGIGAEPATDAAIRVRVLDRRAVPSTPEGEASALPALEEAARQILGEGATVSPDWAPPAPVTARLRAI